MLSKIWSSWRSTFCDVITTCKYFQFTVLQTFQLHHHSFSLVPGVLLFFIWCQTPSFSLCKGIYLRWVYLERKSEIVQHILKIRGQVHYCPFESIWFAISQPLCIMHMSNIYSYFFYANYLCFLHMTKWLPRFIYVEHKTQYRVYILPGIFWLLKTSFLSHLCFFSFWNRNWVSNLPQLMFQWVFRHGLFNLQ